MNKTPEERIVELEAENIYLRKMLTEIATSDHCIYQMSGPYSTGVADGHRCAAKMARKALEKSDSLAKAYAQGRADEADAVEKAREDGDL